MVFVYLSFIAIGKLHRKIFSKSRVRRVLNVIRYAIGSRLWAMLTKNFLSNLLQAKDASFGCPQAMESESGSLKLAGIDPLGCIE